MNVFKALGQMLTSTTNVFTVTAGSLEKAVLLIDKELDNLSTEQSIRMMDIEHEQSLKIIDFKAKLKLAEDAVK